jgi:hypothetical protein
VVFSSSHFHSLYPCFVFFFVISFSLLYLFRSRF